MLNPIEEAKFAELKSKCRELGVPSPPEIMIGLRVHDRNGILTFDDIQRGHSWTRNFYNLLFSLASSSPGSGSNNFGAGYLSYKATDNSMHYSSLYQVSTYSNAAVGGGFINSSGNGDWGIVFGTGDAAFSSDGVALNTKIAHGNSATQLYYNSMGACVPSYLSESKTWKGTISRFANNNSGGNIEVKEIGLYTMSRSFTTGGGPWMLERSVLDPTVAVANGAQLTVTYEISMDFSAID